MVAPCLRSDTAGAAFVSVIMLRDTPPPPVLAAALPGRLV